MEAHAVVFERPEHLSLKRLGLVAPSDGDVVVDVEWTGISSGTERLLFSGRMPAFPGMGYPLVPGYESVGRVVQAGAQSGRAEGDRVFVAGARCYEHARALFGGAGSRLVIPGAKAIVVNESLEERAILLALAATAQHAILGGRAPDLIVGHGVLGRLLARLALIHGAPAPTVWETNPARRTGATRYQVIAPDEDTRKDYRSIYDVSGSADPTLIDRLIGILAPRGELVLAGFYDQVSFRFTPAFHREARVRVAAEFSPVDLETVVNMANVGTLSLHNLITHSRSAHDAADAYATAFGDAECVKMILDWRNCA